jgi:hypothetical protein
MAQTARVTVTLSNIATEEDLHNLEDKMSALSDAISELRATVERLTLSTSSERVAELEAALQAERDAAAALAASEAAEDVDQQAQLDEAKAATDALVAEMTSAASDLGTITEQLASVGSAVDEAPDDTPVGEVEVNVPAPDAEVQSPEPVPAPGEDVPTEDAPADADVPSNADSDGAGTPVPADPASPPAGGPVDADGNPVDGPAL